MRLKANVVLLAGCGLLLLIGETLGFGCARKSAARPLERSITQSLWDRMGDSTMFPVPPARPVSKSNAVENRSHRRKE
jgi:hypothetical protein